MGLSQSKTSLHPITNLRNYVFSLVYIQVAYTIHDRYKINPTFMACIENQELFIGLIFYLVLFFPSFTSTREIKKGAETKSYRVPKYSNYFFYLV